MVNLMGIIAKYISLIWISNVLFDQHLQNSEPYLAVINGIDQLQSVVSTFVLVLSTLLEDFLIPWC